MSKIDELGELIGGIADKIGEALTESVGSAQEAEQVGTAGAALGADALVEGMAQVKAQLDGLTETLKAASERTGEIKALALSVGENG